jgi:hypothetical protein
VTDPKRLLETRELGELGKSALGAAVELEPPEGERERVWSDLGAKLPFAGEMAPDMAADLGGAGLGAAGGAAATGTASAIGVTFAKVTGGLVALGAMATGGVVASGAFDGSPPGAASVSSAARAPRPGGAQPAPSSWSTSEPSSKSAPAAVASPSDAPKAPPKVAVTEAATANPSTRSGSGRRIPQEVEASAPGPSTASFPTSGAKEASSLNKAARPDLIAAAREESRLVGAAREALRAGDSRAALALLAEARERFPAGVLGQERAALGVEAAMQSGSRAEGLESARRFLATFPNSPHAARVRALVATTPAP